MKYIPRSIFGAYTGRPAHSLSNPRVEGLIEGTGCVNGDIQVFIHTHNARYHFPLHKVVLHLRVLATAGEKAELDRMQAEGILTEASYCLWSLERGFDYFNLIAQGLAEPAEMLEKTPVKSSDRNNGSMP